MSNKFLRLVCGLKPCGNPSQRFLLAILADHADDTGRCWPGEELLCAETELGARTVRRALNGLAARGLIVIHRKAVGALHRHNAYTLNSAQLQAEQRTPVTVTGVQRNTPVTMIAVHRPNENSTPATMAAALEPPLTPNRTPIRALRVVSTKPDKHGAKEVPPFELAAFISTQAWENFEQHRIRKGAPLNDFTRWQVQARLQRFHAEGQDTDEIIENSIISNWTGVFPLKSAAPVSASQGIARPMQTIDKLRRFVA